MSGKKENFTKNKVVFKQNKKLKGIKITLLLLTVLILLKFEDKML